jgi:hypothetical protein
VRLRPARSQRHDAGPAAASKLSRQNRRKGNWIRSYRSPVIADDQAQDLHEKVTAAQEGERHPLTDVLLSGVVTAGEGEGCVGAAIRNEE